MSAFIKDISLTIDQYDEVVCDAPQPLSSLTPPFAHIVITRKPFPNSQTYILEIKLKYIQIAATFVTIGYYNIFWTISEVIF